MIIYCDGACRGNPGAGGWSFVCFDHHGREIFYDGGSEDNTTNNRMELIAAIMACEYASFRGLYSGKRKQEKEEAPEKREGVEIWTDSQYVQKGITEWVVRWKNNNWRGSKGPIKNVELWQRLDAVSQYLQPKWSWVKGHSGDEKNDRADFLAQQYADLAKPAAKKVSSNTKTSDKIYLSVPFSEKEEAKKCGARWDPKEKKWFVLKLSDSVKKWLKNSH